MGAGLAAKLGSGPFEGAAAGAAGPLNTAAGLCPDEPGFAQPAPEQGVGMARKSATPAREAAMPAHAIPIQRRRMDCWRPRKRDQAAAASGLKVWGESSEAILSSTQLSKC